MNNEPVAELVLEQMTVGDASALRVNWLTPVYPPVGTKLYIHPHPDNLGLAESIIKQQELRIAELEKDLHMIQRHYDQLNHDTTPQIKELSDEEIWKELTTVKHTWIATTSVWFEFEKEELTKAIRAILKKASEK